AGQDHSVRKRHYSAQPRWIPGRGYSSGGNRRGILAQPIPRPLCKATRRKGSGGGLSGWLPPGANLPARVLARKDATDPYLEVDLAAGSYLCEDVLSCERCKGLVGLDQDVDVGDSHGETLRIFEIPHERVPLLFRHCLNLAECVDVLALERDPVL